MNDLRLLDPTGLEIPYRIVTDFAPAGRVVASVTAVEPVTPGWHVFIDVGEEPPRHQGIEIRLLAEAQAVEVQVHGSADAAEWTQLASGTVFRLGPAENLTGATLSYPATDSRYLRLSWPESAGFPEISHLELIQAGERLLPTQIEIAELTSDEPGAEAHLQLPGGAYRTVGLTVEWTGRSAVGYRLLVPDQGNWSVVSVGALSASPGQADNGASLQLRGELDARRSARFAIASGTREALGITGVTSLSQPVWVDFEALLPGNYMLTYGAPDLAPPDYPVEAMDEWTSGTILEPGPEIAHPINTVAEPLARLGPTLVVTDFDDVAPVTASAGVGQPAELMVPLWAYGSDPDLGSLRLVTPNGQVPYVSETSPDPVLVTSLDEAVPETYATGRSRLVIELPAAPMPLTAIELLAAAFPFEREVRVAELDRDPRVSEPTVEGPALGDQAPRATSAPLSRDLATSVWRCAGTDVLPCRFAAAIPASQTRFLIVEFADGDNPPLPNVSVDVWRSESRLVFPWPDASELWLAVGNLSVARAPEYDLASIRHSLLQSDAAPATVGDRLPDVEPQEPWEPDRALFLGLLALAAIALVALLARTLRAA